MTRAEQILREGLEDATAYLGLLESTCKEFHMKEIAEVVRQMKNKTSAALARADALLSTHGVQPK